MKHFLWTIGLAAIAAGCTGEADVVVVQGDAIEHGRALFGDPTLAKNSYNSYSCASCHTVGDPGALLLPGAPMVGVVERPSYWGGQEPELLRAINDCLYYFMLKDGPWKAEDTEARAMFAYLDSLAPTGAGAEAVPFSVVVTITDLPPGDAARGEPLYDAACKSCHGALHSGTGRLVARAPALPDQTLGEHPLGEYTELDRRLVFIEKVRHGAFLGYPGQMPPFSLEILSDDALADILTYMGL